MKRVHYFSGITISLFIILHLFNHLISLVSVEKHIETMNFFRVFYRNFFVEILLILAVLIQIISGIKLYLKKRKFANPFFEKIQIWTGLYLAIFFTIHLTAVLIGRHLLKLDTNFYFGAAGIYTFPFNLFFIPYYGLAIISIFGHLAAVHSTKMKYKILYLEPTKQSVGILIFGIFLAIIILFGLTDNFNWVPIPGEYNILIGK